MAQEVTATSCHSCLDIHLGDFNVFVREDYSGGNTVDGKVAAGGNITMSGLSVGKALPDDNVSNTLVAGGNLNIKSGNVFGATWYGGNYTNDWSVNFHRGVAAKGTPIDFAARFTELRGLSSRLSQLTANGTAVRENWGAMTLTGTDPCMNVFDVSASDFTGTTQRNIFVPAGAFALVNIHGTGTTLGGGFNTGLDAQHVLYNFVDATSFDARNFGLTGTVLAPNARVTLNQGGWTGGLYALSLSGNAIGHLSPLQDSGSPQAEVCNGVDDDCNGQVDEGFECSGSSTRNCTAWCGAEGTQTCDAATCGYGECTSASCCHADGDCSSSSYCEGTLCVAKKDNGQSCGGANQCASGECVDGVCCNTACGGACDACNLSGHEGTCSPVASTVQCRASGGECDVAEFCTGNSAECPADAKKPATTECRGSAQTCDAIEYCTGTSNTCPSDVLLPAGSPCDDGNSSTTGDTCNSAGVCTGCGDGVRNGSEACDDGNIVSETSCPYGQATCTACNATCSAILNLQGAYCSDGAKNGPEACDDGNTVTETSCSYGQTTCTACNATCSSVLALTGGFCGDGAKNGPETCDDGNTVTETSCPYGQATCNACNATCSTSLTLTGAYCGDGSRNGSETCDDGNTVSETSCPYGQTSCTACNATCSGVLNLHGPYCGDGARNGSETCDDGNTTNETSCPYGQASCTACNATCSGVLNLHGAYCGDGVRNGSEACDDGNTTTESSCPNGQTSCTVCNATCSAVVTIDNGYCGDGERNGSEACDDGNNTNESFCPYGQSCTYCNANCSSPLFISGGYCGDGVANGPEACDDGNNVTETSCPNGAWTCNVCNYNCSAYVHIDNTPPPPSDCPSKTVSWSQWQPAWNNNPRTQGTYFCSGTLSATSHGSRATASQVRGTIPELFRTGSVQYTCNNGSWELVAGSETCDGLPYSTYHVTCAYGSDPARNMFLGFYMNELKRCADLDGLNWWTSHYNDDCLPPDYKGLGSKEACFRVEFLRGPEDDEVQANGGHITSTSERNQCGTLAAASWTGAYQDCKPVPGQM